MRDQLGLPVLRSGRMIGAFEDDEMAGIGLILDKQITVPAEPPSRSRRSPGYRSAQTAAAADCSATLMQHQLHGLHESGGEAIAALTASESGIYGRFGYGVAIEGASAEVAMPSALRRGLVAEPVRERPLDEAHAR